MKPKPKPETAHPEFDKALVRGIERANMNPGRRFGIFYNRETRKSYAVADPEYFLKSEPLAKTTSLVCTVHYTDGRTVINWPNGDRSIAGRINSYTPTNGDPTS